MIQVEHKNPSGLCAYFEHIVMQILVLKNNSQGPLSKNQLLEAIDSARELDCCDLNGFFSENYVDCYDCDSFSISQFEVSTVVIVSCFCFTKFFCNSDDSILFN